MSVHEHARLPGTMSRSRTLNVSRNLESSPADDLVRLARAGDQLAFEMLVQRYERPIYALAYRMIGNREDALDVTQDCFIRAYKNLDRTNPDLNMSAWLHRIASNACLDALRRRKRIRWLPWDAAQHDGLMTSDRASDPEQMAISHEDALDVQHVLDLMKEKHRLALLLREYQGLSLQEIGEVMGVSGPAVKSMLFRARNEFRDMYNAEYGQQRLPCNTVPAKV
jgi:RNA polymerase sigma-70 factor, ECF subfamily